MTRAVLLRIAVIALEHEPELTVRRAAIRVGVWKDSVSAAWRAKHGARHRRVPLAASEAQIEPFAQLCDEMAAVLTDRPQSARVVFAQFPEVHERRKWRAMQRLVATGRAALHGKLHTGAEYTRMP